MPGRPRPRPGWRPATWSSSWTASRSSRRSTWSPSWGRGQPGQQVSLGVRTRTGQTQSLPVVLRRVPALVTSSDRFQPANVTVAALRALMATTTDPALQPIVRLNLAAALLRAGDSAEALALL